MKLFITGASGFIGSNFVNYWLEKYPMDEVTNYDLMTYAASNDTVERAKGKWGSRYQFIKGDICDKETVEKALKGHDLLINFAAESHVDRSITNPRQFVETNVLGTLTLLNACLNAGGVRMHHISTDEVFGTIPMESDEKFNADSPLRPRSPYSASKAGAEHLVNAFFETYQLPVTMTNCSNNYGPYQFPEKLIPLYIIRASKDKVIPIYGTGEAIRDWLFVEDHCRGIDAVIKNGRLGQKYAIGGGEALTTVQVAHKILAMLGKSKDLLRFTSDRKGHDHKYLVDPSKIKTELGWEPLESFDSGIKKTVDWYLENRQWWEPLTHEAEKVAESYLQSSAK